MNKNSSKMYLSVCTKIWNKETDDLFDFEADEIIKRDFRIEKKDRVNYVMCVNDAVCIIKDISEVKEKLKGKNAKILGEIKYIKKGHFQISNTLYSNKLSSFNKSSFERLWVALPRNESRLVEEGDIIKLGRARLKIDKIVLRESEKYRKTYSSNIIKTNIINSIEMKSQEIMIKDETSFACKICFNCHSDVEDPLISPCKCSGSMKYIHYRCLKQSINIKINTKSGDNYVSYLWKNFECEICLTTYPKYIKYNSIMYNLIDLDIKYDQYIVFDYSLYDDNMRKCVKKGMIVTKIRDTEDITIGRTTTNTLKLKDISVSRLHCSITKKDNNIYVTDRNSKFGTLLHLNKSFILAHDIKNKQKSFYFDTNINIVSGKVLLNLKTNSNCNYLQSFFSNALCCRYKSSSEDEFVINVDEFNDEESNNFKSIEKSNVNDTYIDYILNLDLNINSENNIL